MQSAKLDRSSNSRGFDPIERHKYCIHYRRLESLDASKRIVTGCGDLISRRLDTLPRDSAKTAIKRYVKADIRVRLAYAM